MPESNNDYIDWEGNAPVMVESIIARQGLGSLIHR
jgi:hypothetical protein